MNRMTTPTAKIKLNLPHPVDKLNIGEYIRKMMGDSCIGIISVEIKYALIDWQTEHKIFKLCSEELYHKNDIDVPSQSQVKKRLKNKAVLELSYEPA